MPVRVTPDTYGNTYEFSLTGLDQNGNETTIGLRPIDNRGKHSIHAVRYSGYPTGTLRGESGEGEFSLKRKPYGEFSRRDWSGGIGELSGLTDAKKYWMGKRAWSVVPERMMLSPKLFRADIGTPARVGNEPNINYPVTYQSIDSGTRFAWKVTTTADSSGIDVLIRTLVPTVLMVNIRSDSSGEPGANISSTIINDVVLGSNRYQIDIDIATGTFWIEIYGSTAWEIGTAAQTQYNTLVSTDGTTWEDLGYYAPVFFMMSTTGADEWIFFNYRWGTYAISGQKLYINGDRGACDSNSGNLNTLVDATKSWTTDQWKGAIVKVNQGAYGWRKIIGNAATTLTVDRPFTTAHSATSTWYVILGASKWTEITGHGFTADAIDAETVREEVVYFALGPDQQMRRMREYNNGGTWTRDFDEDTVDTQGGTVLPGANYLCSAFDQIDGPVLYKVVNGSSVEPGFISKAPAVSWGTDLTWGTEIKVGSDNWEDLSGICEYDGKIVVTAMDSVWMVDNGYAEKVSIDMQNQWTGFTGRRPAVMPPYLVFPFGNRVQRLYQSIVESFGPERDSSLPKRYDGQVMDNLSLVGGLVICKDGGKPDVYASDAEGGAFLNRDGGWHPLAFTGLGSSMRALWYQRREDEMDMMWFGDHNGLWYMYVPRGWDYTKDPMYEQATRLEEDGWFITGWFDTGQLLPQKWWDFITVFADNLSDANGRKVRVYYQTSDGIEYEVENLAANWTFAEEITSGFNNTITLNVQGRRIRFLVLLMGDGDSTPVLHGYTCNYVSKDDDAESWQMAVSIKDFAYDKAGTPDEITTVKEKADLINFWARTVRPLTMNCEWPLWDDREVQILRPGLVPLEAEPEGRENMYASMTILGMEEPVDEPSTDYISCPLDAPVNGPYAIVMAGSIEHGDITALVGGIPKTIRTPEHANVSKYVLNGTFYKNVDAAWAETAEDDFYYVYGLDGNGDIVAIGTHDPVDPENLQQRTGTFSTAAPTKIEAIKISLDVTELTGLSFDFAADEQGWVFNNLSTAAGDWSLGELRMWSTSGWAQGYWRYTYATDLFLHTTSSISIDHQVDGPNYYLKFDINITLASGRTGVIRYNGLTSNGTHVIPIPDTINLGYGDETTEGAKVNYIQWVADLGMYTSAGYAHLDNVVWSGVAAADDYKITFTSAELENVCP